MIADHAVDVISDPTSENLAHSINYCKARILTFREQQRNAFKLLQIALAELATKRMDFRTKPTVMGIEGFSYNLLKKNYVDFTELSNMTFDFLIAINTDFTIFQKVIQNRKHNLLTTL